MEPKRNVTFELRSAPAFALLLCFCATAVPGLAADVAKYSNAPPGSLIMVGSPKTATNAMKPSASATPSGEPSRDQAASTQQTTNKAVLQYFTVYPFRLRDGRYIDTPRIPKLGYVGKKPDVVVDQILSAEKRANRDVHGEPRDGSFQMVIVLTRYGKGQLGVLSKSAPDHTVLIQLGDIPLMPIGGQFGVEPDALSFELRDAGEADQIFQALQRLVVK
jgi:hypothetical protein